ncbi:MAG TPA: hypothetical protein VGI39_12205 [Polyangiaceae bacterium]|jgi:hypothetical protein
MKAASRVRWSLAAALVVHAVAIVWAPRVFRPKAQPAQTDERVAPMEIAIAVEPAPETPLPESPQPESAPAPTPAHPQPATATRPSSPAPASPGGPVTEASVGPVASAAPGGAETWTFSPTRPGAEGGTTGTASAPGPLASATNAGVGSVVAAWEQKAEDRERRPHIYTPQDFEVGLVPGGKFASLARDRVRSSITPLNGHALLEFWTDKRGIVARVRVLSASSDPHAWDEVADALREDARSAPPLKIPSNADGLIVTIDVTSMLKTLSGSNPNDNALVKALRAAQNPVDAILDSKASPVRTVATKVVDVQAF